MPQLFINNFSTTIASTFGALDTQMTLTSVAGLPALGANDYFLLTVYKQQGVEEQGHEVVKVTSLLNNILTVVRSFEGAPASQFLAGSRVQARLTAGTLRDKANQADLLAAQTTLALKANSTDVAVSISAAISGLVDSSPAALDTLKELATALNNDPNFAATTAQSIGNRLRVDGPQGLSAPQQAQARTNLGLATVAATGAKADIGLGNVDNTSDVNKPVSAAVTTALVAKQNTADKDANNGYVGKTNQAINFKDGTGTFVSQLVNSNTEARVYTFPDKTGVVATVSDITDATANVATRNGVETLTNKTIVDTIFALTGTTPSLMATNGAVQTWTLTASSTPTDSLVSGQAVILMIEPSTYQVTWPSVVWTKLGGNGVAPSLFTAGTTSVVLWKVGTTLYGSHIGDTV